MRTKLMVLGCLAVTCAAQQARPAGSPGARLFEASCGACHGGDANGSDRGPALFTFLAVNSNEQTAALIRTGRKGMPAHRIANAEMADLLAHLRSLPTPRGAPGPRMASVRLTGGGTLEGLVRAESNFHMFLLTADGKLHRLVRDGDVYEERPVAPKQDWPGYDGDNTGSRYSTLTQINTTTAKRLSPAWFFPTPEAPRIESTPVVVDGVMYVTAVNEVWALDAASGRQIWHYQQPRTDGLLGEAGGGANRGIAVGGDRVFLTTDHAHLVALNRLSGRKLWDTEMADHINEQYAATGAPMVIGDLVMAGVAGGEEGVRGFLDAYSASSGERVWRFWTIPKPGEKLSETWIGTALEHGCGATWLTGSYDPALDLLYWSVGNPCPDFNGDERKGDNLYTGSVLALRPKSGELKWYYQFSPHDTHDWDASQPMLMVDEPWEGRPRKLLVHADRNGYFFVLDRTNGELLLAKPYLQKVTWTNGYGKDGKPVINPNSEPTFDGALVCPAVGGGTNWMSASYSPAAKLFFFQANETCAVYKKVVEKFELGKRWFGGNAAMSPGSRSYFRALDIQTGKTVWDYQMQGTRSTSGTLSTAGGLVFFGDSGGEFTALDAKTGKRLWHYNAGQAWRASPMTYMVGGQQYVAIGGPSGFFAFALGGE